MAQFHIDNPLVFAFGVLGNIISICVFLSPLPTFIRICKEKSTMGYQSVPYVVALFSAMLWMYYALMKHAFPLITINSVGLVIETIYIFIYLLYAAKEARKFTTRLLATLNVGIFCVIFIFTHFALGPALRLKVVGWICVAFSVSVFAAPLSIVFQVVRTRSVEFMPFALTLALTISAVMWFSYGLFLHDICIAIPNVLGFLLGVIQMVLYGMYRNAKPIEVDEEKKMPVETVLNIVVLGNSKEVHPIDSQSSSSSCEVEAAIDELDNKKKIEEERDNTNLAEKHLAVATTAAAVPEEPCCGGKAIVQIEPPPPVLDVCAVTA